MSSSDVAPSSMGIRTAAAEKCDHFWIYKKPAGTKEGVEICQFCHQPNPADLDRLASLNLPPADLRDALQRAHDGESPDALVEELRQPLDDQCRRTCEPGDCGFVGTGVCGG